MSESEGHIRRAVGALNTRQMFWGALEALSEQGIERDQLCLAGRADELATLAPDPVTSDHLGQQASRLIDEMRPLEATTAYEVTLLAGKWLQEALSAKHLKPSANVQEGPEQHWIAPEQRAQLRSLATARLVLLGIQSHDRTQQLAATRILLRHCTNGVQTYDFVGRSSIG